MKTGPSMNRLDRTRVGKGIRAQLTALFCAAVGQRVNNGDRAEGVQLEATRARDGEGGRRELQDYCRQEMSMR